VSGCNALNFVTFTDFGGCKGTCWEMLHNPECEMLRFWCEWLQDFKVCTVTGGECGKNVLNNATNFWVWNVKMLKRMSEII